MRDAGDERRMMQEQKRRPVRSAAKRRVEPGQCVGVKRAITRARNGRVDQDDIDIAHGAKRIERVARGVCAIRQCRAQHGAIVVIAGDSGKGNLQRGEKPREKGVSELAWRIDRSPTKLTASICPHKAAPSAAVSAIDSGRIIAIVGPFTAPLASGSLPPGSISAPSWHGASMILAAPMNSATKRLAGAK
jgi:hypothetical protein